jgi:hypothetical protein
MEDEQMVRRMPMWISKLGVIGRLLFRSSIQRRRISSLVKKNSELKQLAATWESNFQMSESSRESLEGEMEVLKDQMASMHAWRERELEVLMMEATIAATKRRRAESSEVDS